ncbi:hypothetical protein CIHG_04283 [Coccidioides immitis H538.4]|uniref:Uncharacterized protein n=3 Tax=Coccidioides immitis TaxID=5501 RepID=A0A0J8U367_COCIT|nr:hypothetical protein CIRG_09212 [Coccidioides immitis RMSCC 2394]KMU81127.1 hypothetical protein CISG_02504 [Coccidioides immitis RMSCC 3703]KMU86494.1 hypothetical protein CIHG_04283 [Coccidioides immitis H538.4]
MLLKGEVNMPASFARRVSHCCQLLYSFESSKASHATTQKGKKRDPGSVSREAARTLFQFPLINPSGDQNCFSSTDVVNETGLESTLARSDSELAPNTHPSSSLRRLILLARFASWQQSCQSCIQQRGATMPVDSEKLRVSTAEFDGGETSKLCFSYGTR